MYRAFQPEFALFPEPINPLEWVQAIDNHIKVSFPGEVLLRGVKRLRDHFDEGAELRSTRQRCLQESSQSQFRSLLDMRNEVSSNTVNNHSGRVEQSRQISATEAGENRAAQEDSMDVSTGNTTPSEPPQQSGEEGSVHIFTGNTTQNELSPEIEGNRATGDDSIHTSTDNTALGEPSPGIGQTEEDRATEEDSVYSSTGNTTLGEPSPGIGQTEEDRATEEDSVYSSTDNNTPGELSSEIDLMDGLTTAAGADFDRLFQELNAGTSDQGPGFRPQPNLRDMMSTMTNSEASTRSSVSNAGSAASSRDLLDMLQDQSNPGFPQWPAAPMRSDLELNRNQTLATQSSLDMADCDMIANSWPMRSLDQAIADFLVTESIPRPENPTSNINMTSEETNNINGSTSLQDTLVQQWPDKNYILFYGTLLTRTNVEQVLYELQKSPSLSVFTVDVLGDRLSYHHSPPELHIADATWFDCLHRGILRLNPIPQTLLLPTRTYNYWSLIEIHIYSGTVIHYLFPENRSEVQDSSHFPHRPACRFCQAAIKALSHYLEDIGQPCPEWQVDSMLLSSIPGDNGIGLIWTMTQRANGQDVQNGPPETFRAHLAHDIVMEALQTATDAPSPPPPQPPPGLSPKSSLSLSLSSPVLASEQQTNSLERAHCRWSNVMIRSGDPINLTGLWNRVSQMSLDSNTSIGPRQADRLLQLALTIASPPILVEVKRQLEHLRREQSNATRRFQRSAAGVFAAGIWHKNNEQTSRIGLVLTYCDPIAQLATDIYNQLPDTARDYSEVEEKVRDWCKRAWPWNQLVRIAGSPNVLCFLPQGITYFPGEDAPSMTEYRCIKKHCFKAIEMVLRECRPQLLKFIPQNFFEIFLYNQLPETQYAIEQWTEEEILAEPLDSDKFDHAFDLVLDTNIDSN
ncbi:hypothetical protein BDV37DRAFT_276491 [Aspergillus pseudonomiae]|uniref:Uncharacterized protein n=1 Tax=Aspergillus pseudonomiae TaxID=1506151 RepID=A0A5N7CUU9_9EURO|nr:uncharacterized protein BDV37DRAFT_276491 [Aspergillus pseudonomiae]KAE8397970.1 hypothetical protein BDV37DRAFT_276491 [Aspergillus pseudonomiae]